MANLNNSTDLISYKEAKITIPANDIFKYENPYNFIRILESTGTSDALLFRFGPSSIETLLTVGCGLRFNELLPSVTIKNLTGSAVTIRVAEIQGDIYDDRLTVSGTVETIEQPLTVRQVSQETFDSNGEISVDSTSYKKVVIQNNSSSPIYLFTNNTFEIQPTGSFELNYAGQFKIYGTTSENVSLALFN